MDCRGGAVECRDLSSHANLSCTPMIRLRWLSVNDGCK